MTTYAPKHASAYAKIAAAGAAVTFTRTTTTLDPDTDLVTPTETTVAGYAIRVPGDPTKYARGGWTLSTMPTLLAATTTYGAAIAVGDTVAWGGTTYTVRDVEPLDLDAAGAILATVVIAV